MSDTKQEEARNLWLVKMILDLYTDHKISIFGEIFSDHNTGVLQGSVLSPLIFNVLVEDFIDSSEIIKEFVKQDRCLYYADDAVIFHKDKQRLADCLAEYVSHGKSYGMQVN